VSITIYTKFPLLEDELKKKITIKEHEKDKKASAPPVFSLKLRPRPYYYT
jgi:hypothetical protein